MAAEIEHNPLLSTQKTSDTGLQVALHPLVLLTISDYITRHTLRQQTGPVVGGLLGQQNGREITIEHAFECLLEPKDDGEIVLHEAWFEERLQQMKDVHKVPLLDLVGWYTILPTSGPQPAQLPIHRQILASYNESAILLGFHPTAVLEGSVGGKLPLTIYESNYEADEPPVESGEDKEMTDIEPKLGLKFKELPYTVETGEAEMISVDFVARGGGNATAVDGTVKPKKIDNGTKATFEPPSDNATPPGSGKGKSKASSSSVENSLDAKVDNQNVLSREDEERIASLTAKANAIKMLHARINLIATYLQQLPPSYISSEVPASTEPDEKQYAPVNHSVLRSIQALLSHLTLLIPADRAAFEHELISEQNDVSLVSLLGEITQSIKDAREMGAKYKIIDTAKLSRKAEAKGSSWGDGGGSGIMGAGDLMG